MAESQLMCMDDGHINEKISESKPEFYYSEEQRAALEQLLKDGDCAFKSRLKADNVKDFLSAQEIKSIRNTFQEYGTNDEEDLNSVPTESTKTDSGIHSTYWPELSDIEVPPLDIGWPDGGFYKGVTRVTVYAHPPKEEGPHIKQVVRKLIQEANKVVAVAMDLLTDLQILQDLLDAAGKRNVSVYVLLDAGCVPHFLDMCRRLQISNMHLKNIRVRTVQGTGLSLSFGKLPGSLSSKYMLVDGDKVMFGSYSFTWSNSRVDRGMITVMTGQVVDFFDRDFREMYAVSESVDLYKELHVVKPCAATPAPKPARVAPKVEPKAIPSATASTSRFQVSLGSPRQEGPKIPAHKYYNPKYSLVVGPNAEPTGSLKDLPGQRGPPGGALSHAVNHRLLQASSEKLDRLSPLPSSPAAAEAKDDAKTPNGLPPAKKKRSFRVRLKVKTANLNSGDSESASPSPSPTRAGHRSLSPSPTRAVPATASEEEQGDRFENSMPEKSTKPRGKYSTLSKLSKSISLLTVHTTDEDGSKVLKRPQKRGCIQS